MVVRQCGLGGVGCGSAWWLIKLVEIVEQWRTMWFVIFDQRGSWVLIGSGDRRGSWVLIKQWRSDSITTQLVLPLELLKLCYKGMANLYLWSSKRSYKNDFVWHDLLENKFIYPALGQEYVLKGSEFHELNLSPKLHETIMPSTSSSLSRFLRPPLPEMNKSGEDLDFLAVITRRRNQSWSSINLYKYKVYKVELSFNKSFGKAAADVSTQTKDKRRRRKPVRAKEIEEDEEEGEQVHEEKSQC
nr:protein UPSTREAM OF FLC-like [Quercus suber]